MRRRIPSITMLLAFESAARSLSFTQAGKELSLTQSAISHQIHGLEEALQTRLFDRVRQRLVLTSAGSLLLSRLSPALNTLESAVLETMASQLGSGNVQLAVPPTFAAKWLIPRLAAFSAAHPDIFVHLTMRLGPPDFEDGRLDAAVYFGEPLPDAECTQLMAEESVVVASPAVAGSLRTPEDLQQAPLLHLTSRASAWQEWAAARGLPLDTGAGPRFELFSMVAQAAAAGLGVAVLPRFLVLDELLAGRLVTLFGPPLPSARAAYYVACPASRAGLAPVRLLRDWLLAQA